MNKDIIINCNEKYYYNNMYEYYDEEDYILLDKCPLIGLLNFLFIKYLYY